MTGLEVEDLAVFPAVGTAGTEHFAALEGADEDDFVRLGNGEGFAVGFFVIQVDEAADALGDGMAGLDVPDQLVITVFPPGQVAAGAHQAAEGLGMVAGVEENGTHAVQNGPLYPLCHFVGDQIMLHMAPPDQNIGVIQQFFGQVVHIIQSNGADFKIAVQLMLQGHVDALGIQGLHFLVMLLMEKFIVDGNLNHDVPPVCFRKSITMIAGKNRFVQ